MHLRELLQAEEFSLKRSIAHRRDEQVPQGPGFRLGRFPISARLLYTFARLRCMCAARDTLRTRLFVPLRLLRVDASRSSLADRTAEARVFWLTFSNTTTPRREERFMFSLLTRLPLRRLALLNDTSDAFLNLSHL
jgi:hypothetical protein